MQPRPLRDASHRLGAGGQRAFEAVSQAPDTGGPNRFTYWLATTYTDGTRNVAAVERIAQAYADQGWPARVNDAATA